MKMCFDILKNLKMLDLILEIVKQNCEENIWFIFISWSENKNMKYTK